MMSEANKWTVLIVDDEESVHSVTKLALTGFAYQGRQIEFRHAYSGAEARRVMENGQDIAVVLLDVVMETDDAGLQVCNYIRNELNNTKTRILLRTGNPGQAPEQEVIMNYEINDYIEKTDLTMGRLINHMVVALRGYRDLCALENTRDGYREMVSASADMDGRKVPDGFVDGAMRQLAALLYLDTNPNSPHVFALGKLQKDEVELLNVMSAQGSGATQSVPEAELDVIKQAMHPDGTVAGEGDYLAQARLDSGNVYVLYLVTGDRSLSAADRDLVDLFCARLGRFVDRRER